MGVELSTCVNLIAFLWAPKSEPGPSMISYNVNHVVSKTYRVVFLGNNSKTSPTKIFTKIPGMSEVMNHES